MRQNIKANRDKSKRGKEGSSLKKFKSTGNVSNALNYKRSKGSMNKVSLE